MAKPVKVSQPSNWIPTRKLSGALIAAAAWELINQFALPVLGVVAFGPATSALIQLGIAAAAGYLIKDRKNA